MSYDPTSRKPLLEECLGYIPVCTTSIIPISLFSPDHKGSPQEKIWYAQEAVTLMEALTAEAETDAYDARFWASATFEHFAGIRARWSTRAQNSEALSLYIGEKRRADSRTRTADEFADETRKAESLAEKIKYELLYPPGEFERLLARAKRESEAKAAREATGGSGDSGSE